MRMIDIDKLKPYILDKHYKYRLVYDAEEVANAPTITDRPTDEEDQLKFYYVESIDDYWIGMRIDNFYYANWHEGLGFVWSHSRYLPWGEHVVAEKTLWKEHTYPSEPVEISFTDWIVGFVKKYFADRPTGEWIDADGNKVRLDADGHPLDSCWCSNCGEWLVASDEHKVLGKFCPNCGKRMYKGGDTE